MGRLKQSRPNPDAVRKKVRPPGLRLARFLAAFTLCVLVAFGLLVTPFARPAVQLFSRVLVQGSALLISLGGGAVLVEGTVLRSPSNGFAVDMKDGCNGLSVTILLWAAVVAFPAGWGWKVKGLLIGCVAIQCLNFLRFISLFYLGQYNTSWFEFAHTYLWESLIMLDAMVVFWVWVTMISRPDPVADAAA